MENVKKKKKKEKGERANGGMGEARAERVRHVISPR
jgi:hypothetical protein